MSNLLSYEIDWNNITVESSFKPLPEGIYAGKITKSEIKQTKAGNGSYVSLSISLLGGEGVKGRKVFPMHMLEHPNPKAVNIGLGQLKDLAGACGLNYDEISDTSDFHGKVFGLELGIESSEEYGDKNKVKKYVEFDESLLEDTSVGNDVF